MADTPLRHYLQRTLAGIMTVWLSGVVLLICCETMGGKSMDAEFSPLAAKSHHCDKAELIKPSEGVAEVYGTKSIECCSFLPFLFDKDRKVERTEQAKIISTQQAKVQYDIAVAAVKKPIIPRFKPYIPDRQDTFTKNCVFRI